MGIDERSESNALKGEGKAGFTGSMKAPFEPGVSFAEGDVIVFPAEYDESNVFDMPVGNDGTTAECVVVTLKRASGAEEAINFWPSMLAKTIFPAHEEDGEVVSDTPIQVTGTAAAEYQACYGKLGDDGDDEYDSDVAYAMSKFAGRSVIVSDVQKLQQRVWKNGEATDKLRPVNLYTYDWAPEAKKGGKKK